MERSARVSRYIYKYIIVLYIYLYNNMQIYYVLYLFCSSCVIVAVSQLFFKLEMRSWSPLNGLDPCCPRIWAKLGHFGGSIIKIHFRMILTLRKDCVCLGRQGTHLSVFRIIWCMKSLCDVKYCSVFVHIINLSSFSKSCAQPTGITLGWTWGQRPTSTPLRKSSKFTMRLALPSHR